MACLRGYRVVCRGLVSQRVLALLKLLLELRGEVNS